MKKNDSLVCNNCRNVAYKILFDNVTSWEHPGMFRIVACKQCGLVYLNPRPSREEIGKYYPNESYWGHSTLREDESTEWKRGRDKDYNLLYEEILGRKKKGAILDIGAGTGLFLTRFKELGWDVDGVELAANASALAQKTYDIKLKVGDFLDFNFPKNTFDVVTLNNALEHLYDPKKTLEGILRILKTDGIVIITVPNIESFGAKLFGKNWYALQPPRHLFHFSPTTLADMLKRSGFEVTKIDHSYFVHNYYTLFESFRLLFSPRFRQKSTGGLAVKEYKKRFSIALEIGKIIGRIFALSLSYIGSTLRHGEIITAYAKKAI